jgi:hypothetical protein
VIDLLLDVNVEFMLCPTSAMISIFSTLPSWVTFPSYRSTLTIVVVILGYILSYSYFFVAKALQNVVFPAKNIKLKQ